MATSDLQNYGPAIAALLAEPRLQPLGPGTPNHAARALLDRLDAEAFAHATVRDANMAGCCRAALWLYHDFQDEAHRICQDIDTPSGSYWHAILHRREPDYSNAGYWFRRVGKPAIWEPLRQAAAKLASEEKDPAAAFLTRQSTWDPFAFIELCQACAEGKARCEMPCRQVQQHEWQLLFEHCYREATGSCSK